MYIPNTFGQLRFIVLYLRLTFHLMYNGILFRCTFKTPQYKHDFLTKLGLNFIKKIIKYG